MMDDKTVQYFNQFLSIFKYLVALLIKVSDGNLKGFQKKVLPTPATSRNSFIPKLTYIHNSKIAVKLEQNC